MVVFAKAITSGYQPLAAWSCRHVAPRSGRAGRVLRHGPTYAGTRRVAAGWATIALDGARAYSEPAPADAALRPSVDHGAQPRPAQLDRVDHSTDAPGLCCMDRLSGPWARVSP